MKLITYILILAAWILFLTALDALAQPSKATPTVNGNFCISSRTGSVRNLLSRKACAKSEQQVAISVAAEPSALAGTVIDSNGKVVGKLDQDSSDAQQGSIVDMEIQGVKLGLLVSQDGFVDEQANGLQLTRWYTTTDCTGQAFIVVGGDGQGLSIPPLVEVPSAQAGPYVFGTMLEYAALPWASHTFGSAQAFADPSQGPTSGCVNAGDTAPNLGTWMAGPEGVFDLSTLALVPPFTAQ